MLLVPLPLVALRMRTIDCLAVRDIAQVHEEVFLERIAAMEDVNAASVGQLYVP